MRVAGRGEVSLGKRRLLVSYAPLALRESLSQQSELLPNLYVLVMSATMRVVIALQLFAAVGSLELQRRRQALQGLALGAATAAAPAHAGAVVSDEVSLTFKESALGMQLDGLAYQKTTLGSMPSLRCVVTAVAPGSEAAKLGVSDDWTVVSVNGANVESLGAKEVAETFEMNAKGKGVSEKHRGRVVERNEFERMSEEELGIAREANEALKAEFKKRKEMIAKRAGVSVQSLTKSSISTINTNISNTQNQGTKRSRKMEDLDSDKYESDAFSLACDAGNGDDAAEIIFPDSLFDLRGADVAKAGLKAGSGRSRQKVRLIGEDGFDAKTVTIGEVPDRGGRVDESGRFVAKFKGGNKGGSKGETGAATGNNNKRQWRKRK